MILDVNRFLNEEGPYFDELEEMLARFGRRAAPPSLEEARRFHYLYQRSLSDLAKLKTFACEPEVVRRLEYLVARAYGELHAAPAPARRRFSPREWAFVRFPQVFRRHVAAFLLVCLAVAAGTAFGGGVAAFDNPSKAHVLGGFSHLHGDPAERVRMEESGGRGDPGLAGHGTFASELMVNNIRVSVFSLAGGVLWGVGSLLVLFYNGIILGLVAIDYILAGQGVFLAGWLLPHGSFEIPAFMIAGQAGVVLGGAMLGWRSRETLRRRLRAVLPDLVVLICGVAVMLVWAGLVESFFSQYHAPVMPYWIKILFGGLELTFLVWLLAFAGRRTGPSPTQPAPAHAEREG